MIDICFIAYYSENYLMKTLMGLCFAAINIGIFVELMEDKKLTFFNK